MYRLNELVTTLKLLGSSKSMGTLKKVIEESCMDHKTGLIEEASLFGLVITPDKKLSDSCKKLNIYDLVGLESYFETHRAHIAYLDCKFTYKRFHKKR